MNQCKTQLDIPINEMALDNIIKVGISIRTLGN